MRGRVPSIAGKVALVAVLVAATVVTRDRLSRPATESEAIAARPGEGIAGALLPGGLRALVVGAVWIRADRALAEGRVWDLLADYHLLGTLDPENETAWALMAHHLAFTVSLSEATPEGQWLWIREAIELAERGLRLSGGGSKLSGQLGVIYLDRCSGEPWIRQAFAQSKGQSPLLSALESFTRARSSDEGPSRWDPYVVLCLDLLAREGMEDRAFEAAESRWREAAAELARLRDESPESFEAGEGVRWLARVEGWRRVAAELARVEEARAAEHPDEIRRARDAALRELERIREGDPEDPLAREWVDRLKHW